MKRERNKNTLSERIEFFNSFKAAGMVKGKEEMRWIGINKMKNDKHEICVENGIVIFSWFLVEMKKFFMNKEKQGNWKSWEREEVLKSQ